MRNTKLRLTKNFVYLLFALLAQSCGLFVSHYDAGAYQQFTSLKAFHLKFLDDFKDSINTQFDKSKIQTTCDTGNLKFLEATEYAAGKKDETRVKAIKYLHNVFSSDCKLGLKKLFRSEYVSQQTSELKKNYDLAIQGEVSRVGAPSN